MPCEGKRRRVGARPRGLALGEPELRGGEGQRAVWTLSPNSLQWEDRQQEDEGKPPDHVPKVRSSQPQQLQSRSVGTGASAGAFLQPWEAGLVGDREVLRPQGPRHRIHRVQKPWEGEQ